MKQVIYPFQVVLLWLLIRRSVPWWCICCQSNLDRWLSRLEMFPVQSWIGSLMCVTGDGLELFPLNGHIMFCLMEKKYDAKLQPAYSTEFRNLNFESFFAMFKSASIEGILNFV